MTASRFLCNSTLQPVIQFSDDIWMNLISDILEGLLDVLNMEVHIEIKVSSHFFTYSSNVYIFIRINPWYPEGFSHTYFPKGIVATPLQIINSEGHITLNLLPVYRYGHSLSIDTKINTNHSSMTSLWRHNVSTPTKIEKWPFCM